MWQWASTRPGSEELAGRIDDGGASRHLNARARSSVSDPIAFDDDDGVVYRLRAGAIDEPRAGDDNRRRRAIELRER